ncbi:hypothetical protein SBA4_6000012 [Candidatus Sulfopaludibacter sp. SbA4]|nr:hypothetical protein SBA4_6000012 [Candidatus Sulfopaludibacter sp. SbA4]
MLLVGQALSANATYFAILHLNCGADPLVRAGRPRPAFANRIKIRQKAKKADEGAPPRGPRRTRGSAPQPK